MSGLLPVLPLETPPAIAALRAVTPAEPVSNDIRIPSRAALQQQLEVGLSAGPGRSPAFARAVPASAGGVVTLSPAARALSVILDSPAGPASKITGTRALWPLDQPLNAPLTTTLLAATLAHTVDNSGLFYESHLQQFAAGTRTLAQLLQEPQASLPLVVVTGPASLAVDEVALSANVPVAAPSNRPPLMPVNDSASWQEMDEHALKTPGPSALDQARSVALPPAGIHADAVALVRQQLELLAQPVFRWSGEAWPGTPMDWEIHQEPDERTPVVGSEAPQPGWSTRLTVRLSELKDVEVRLSLFGDALQLNLAASDSSTRAMLDNGRHELPTRFAALGLQLRGIAVGALVPKPEPQGEASQYD